MKKFEQLFLSSSAAILLLTGIAKLTSAAGAVRALDSPNPVFLITYRQVFILIGFVEVVLSIILIFDRDNTLKAILVAVIGTDFALYRIALLWLGSKDPCGCLGTLTTALSLSAHTIRSIMGVLMAYLTLGACLLLLYRWILDRVGNACGGIATDE